MADPDLTNFNRLYANASPAQRHSLLEFRTQHAPKTWEHDGVNWQYISLGTGEQTALFLPGAIGTFYIWWQQLLHFADQFQLISINYPALFTLEDLQQGINILLEREGVHKLHIIGSSLGGYLAQYLASSQPERLRSVVFANTFPPTQPFLRTAPILRLAIRLLPLSAIYAIYRCYASLRLVPSGGHAPLLKAYLMEASQAGIMKRDMLARIACATQRFEPLPIRDQTFPILIIESDNDPLIRADIRASLRQLYPAANKQTLVSAGHFAYLSLPDTYNDILRRFLTGT